MCSLRLRQRQLVHSWPYPCCTDTTYVTSSARDHYRQQTVAGGFMVERAPEYSNMFSKLPHYPSTTFRYGSSLQEYA
eukprot:1154654-Pelagomonas_calceolata.AAC.1